MKTGIPFLIGLVGLEDIRVLFDLVFAQRVDEGVDQFFCDWIKTHTSAFFRFMMLNLSRTYIVYNVTASIITPDYNLHYLFF